MTFPALRESLHEKHFRFPEITTMAVDATPYGLRFDHDGIDRGWVIGASYKWLSGIALAFVAGITLAAKWVGVLIEHNSTGKMNCNTTVHSLQIEVGLLFFAIHFSFGFAYGKRDDAYLASLPKTFEEVLALRLQQARDAFAAQGADAEKYPGYPPDFGGGSMRQDN